VSRNWVKIIQKTLSNSGSHYVAPLDCSQQGHKNGIEKTNIEFSLCKNGDGINQILGCDSGPLFYVYFYLHKRCEESSPRQDF
jgi:hypothetical protein